jgi:cellulose synthase/poly-beta-1,6-N-acetylglucosamine synthase-like glycosyltransferase
MTWLFWGATVALLYCYFGYPALMFLVARLKRPVPVPRLADDELPTVSLVICAYNEEVVINEKIQNTLALDYPREKLEIIVASDGSSDRTEEIAQGYSQLRLIRYPRTGKTGVICRTIPKSNGTVIVLTDANVYAPSEALRCMVERLSVPGTGAVFANVRLVEKDGTPSASGEGLYWRYETFLKRMESATHTCVGATGAMWGFHKSDFIPIPDHIASDDFVLPMKIALAGKRVVMEERFCVTEQVPQDHSGAIRRKKQVGSGGLQAFLYLREVWIPLAGLIPFCVWSHKVLRWATLPVFAVLLISNLFLAGTAAFYQLSLLLISLILAAALLGSFSGIRNRIPKFLLVSYYFFSMHFAILSGFLRYQAGRHSSRWERSGSER